MAYCQNRLVVIIVDSAFFVVIMSELTSDAVRCCSSCFNRVVRMINGVQSGDSVECSDGRS